MIVFQGIRYQRNRPLIIAEAAVADAKGEAVFEALGVPPDATPTGPGEKQVIAKSSQAPTKRVIWWHEYEAPGAFVVSYDWYQLHLLGDGWKELADGPECDLVRRYCKDKWLVTISR